MSTRFSFEQIVSARTVEDPKISADGQAVVFVVGEASKTGDHPTGNLWIWRAGDDQPAPLTSGSQRDDNPDWSPDGRYITFASDRDQPGIRQLYLLPVDGGEAVRLTDHDGGVSAPLWSPDGSRIAYIVREPEPEDAERRREERDDANVVDQDIQRSQIWLLDLSGGPQAALRGEIEEPVRVCSDEIHVSALAKAAYSWFPDGSGFAAVIAEGPKVDYLWYPELATISLSGEVRRFGTFPGLFARPQVSPDGSKIAFIASGSEAPMAIGVAHALDIESGEWAELEASRSGSVSDLAWLPGGDQLLVNFGTGLRSVIQLLAADGSDVTPAFTNLGSAGGAVIAGPSLSADGQTAAFIYSDVHEGVDVWIGKVGGEAQRISRVNPWISEVATGELREIEWRSSDSQTVQGVVVLPVGYQEGQRYPTLVHIHGGPMGAWTARYYASWHDWAQIMAQRGYAVLLPNPRGSSGRGPGYLAANIHDLGGLEWADINTGVDALIEQGIADPDQLVVGGWSYGGFFTNWAIGHTDRFKAAVSGAGIANWVSFAGTTDIRRIFDAYFPTTSEDDASGQWQSSPIRYICNASTPTLILHGEADERVPLSQSQELYAGLKSLGVPTQLVTYPREPHLITERNHQLDMLRRVTSWYDQHLDKQETTRKDEGMTTMAEKQALDLSGYDDVDSVSKALMEHWGVPGVTVGILKDGDVQLHGYGVASIETNQPVQEDTLFQIGSISKVFTATLIMQLVEEGKLDLDAPVSSYLPDLELQDKTAQDKVTLRHLLSHTSGIYGDFFDDFGNGDDALAKAIEQYKTLRQLTEPGELWSYSNSGFNLAGAVIEKVLEMPYEQAIRERIFQPLGMDRSTFFAHEAIVYPVALGHTEVSPDSDEIQVCRSYPLPRAVNPAGGIISTVEDLLKFAALHINGGSVGDEQLLQPESVAAMQQEQTEAANFADSWGIGWDITIADGQKVIGHGGSTNGFQARLSIVPEQKYAIAVLTNGDRGWAVNNAIAKWGIQHDCGIELPKPTPVELTDQQLARVAGKYSSPNADITVVTEAGGYRIDAVGKDPFSGEEEPMPPIYGKPISEREFVVTQGPMHDTRADIIPNPNGTPRFLRFGGRLADRVD